LAEVEVLGPQQTQLAPLGHPQVLGQCFRGQMALQVEQAMELEAQILRRQVQVVVQVVDCPYLQLLDLQVATVELPLVLGYLEELLQVEA
jgi:hypothetical protein